MTTLTDKELIKEIKERIGSLDIRDNIERRAYEIALASLEAKPIGAFHIAEQQVDGTSDYLKDGEWPIDNGIIEVYAAPPVPVVPEEKPMPNPLSMYAVDAVAAIAEVRGWNACRTAMLQSGNFRESKNSSTNNFREIAEASTSSPVTPALLPGGFTIEEAKELHEDLVRSHISKALSGEKMKKKDRDADLRWIHGVIVQAAWFVKASLEQNALSGNYPVTPDGWISCSERMPDTKTSVLVAVEFDRKGDWRMKWATYIPGHPDANDGWIIPGASWKPSHWMRLPEPPQEVNRG
ncbi:TPA: DUF551 domain-containing protein [Escherichia coli]|nr:DUF551 domain-containing protein [Escherichia coli]HAV7660134.1 DUF551 domain-containing protein [Escherichia coli]HAV9784365.1 DUF551 domain-containing protein [Escherichia coli]